MEVVMKHQIGKRLAVSALFVALIAVADPKKPKPSNGGLQERDLRT